MFTTDNTEGYSQAELDALNKELLERLANVDQNDVEALEAAQKSFHDEVARR